MSSQHEKLVNVQVEVGRRRMTKKEVWNLAVKNIIEFNTDARSPLAIYADGKLIGFGRAVVSGDHYGVRISHIIPPNERV